MAMTFALKNDCCALLRIVDGVLEVKIYSDSSSTQHLEPMQSGVPAETPAPPATTPAESATKPSAKTASPCADTRPASPVAVEAPSKPPAVAQLASSAATGKVHEEKDKKMKKDDADKNLKNRKDRSGPWRRESPQRPAAVEKNALSARGGGPPRQSRSPSPDSPPAKRASSADSSGYDTDLPDEVQQEAVRRVCGALGMRTQFDAAVAAGELLELLESLPRGAVEASVRQMRGYIRTGEWPEPILTSPAPQRGRSPSPVDEWSDG